jgi:hypothetical protein
LWSVAGEGSADDLVVVDDGEFASSDMPEQGFRGEAGEELPKLALA